MSNQALSQDEIDALFTGDAAGDPEDGPSAQASDPEVQLYDFRRPSRVSKDRQRTLEGMYGMLAKSLEGWLAGRVRAQIEVDLAGVDQLSFGEFVLSLPDPCASFVFNIGAPGGPQSVIEMGREFSFYTVERFLGSSTDTLVPDRALTVLERRVVRIVAERVAAQVQEIWADHARFDLRLARFESVPDMLQAANREDPVLVANLRLRFRGVTSPMMVCLPFSVLDAFFATSVAPRIRTVHGAAGDGTEDRNGVERTLRRAALPVSVRLPKFGLTFSEIMSLKPGGTLLTGIRRDSMVDVLVANRCRYRGYVGRTGETLAVQVAESVTEEE